MLSKKMLSKKMLFTLGLMAYLPNSYADLPTTQCTGTSVSELISSCTVTADAPHANGDNGVKLFMANGYNPAVEADVLQSLNKLMVYVRGYGESLESLANVSASLAQFNAQGISILMLAPGAAGQDTIQDNAAALEKTLGMINTYRANSNPSDMVMVGYSQGGLVARYALADLERNGIPHHTSLYVSYDTPHSGIYIPQGMQNMLPLMNEYVTDITNTANNASTAMRALGLDASLRAVADGVNTTGQYVLQAVDSMTTAYLGTGVYKQLLIDNVYPSSATDRAAFIADMDSVGYPTQTQNIAVTNGNTQALPQTQTLTANNSYFSFFGKRGSTNTFSFLYYDFYPTAAGTTNLGANAGTRGTWSYKARCWFFFTCTYNVSASINIPKSKTSGGGVLALDSVSGGRKSMLDYYYGAASFLDYAGIFNPATSSVYPLIYTGQNYDLPFPLRRSNVDSYYSFVPTVSALGLPITTPDTEVANIVAANATPFDLVISNGDALQTNLNHGTVVFTDELVTKILDAL